MAISVDWPTKVITVPRADMQLIQSNPTEIRTLNLESFHLTLRDLEDDYDGMPWDRTHRYAAPVTVGGVQLAAVVEIVNDYTVTFEDGQYAVNLVGANSNVGDRVNVNQVSVRSANSAGLTFSDSINSQSYINGQIWVDPATGAPGYAFPQGTPKAPVNNWPDALLVRSREKLDSFRILSTTSLGASDSIAGFHLEGQNPHADVLVLGGGDTLYADLKALTVVGQMNGQVFCSDICILGNIVNFAGGVLNSFLGGTLTVDVTYTSSINILRCASGLLGGSNPVLDMNGSAAYILVREYLGGLIIKNFNTGSAGEISLFAGTIYLDSSCTSGLLSIEGNGQVIDLATGETIQTGSWNGMTVINNTNDPHDARDARKYNSNRVSITSNKRTVTIYEDDGVTTFKQFDVSADQLDRTPL